MTAQSDASRADGDRGATMQAQISRRNPWFRALGASPLLLLPVVVGLALRAGIPGMLWACIYPVIIAALLSRYLHRRNPMARIEGVELRIDEDVLWVGKRAYRRSTFKNAYLVPEGDHVRLRLVRSRIRRDVEIRVASREQGEQLMSALGFGVKETRGSFVLQSQSNATFMRSCLGTIVFINVAGILSLLAATLSSSLAGVTALLCFVAFLVVSFAPARLDVGADGMVLRWLWMQRYFSYDNVAYVSQSTRGFGNGKVDVLHVKQHNGKDFPIAVTQHQWKSDLAAGIHARIESSMANYRRNEPAQLAALVPRGEAPVLDWVRRLRVTLDVGNLRRGAIDVDALWRVVEDQASRTLDRATAALALGSSLSAPERQRLVRVAESVASPKLRIALEGVAGGEDDEHLAEALQALEEEEQKRQS